MSNILKIEEEKAWWIFRPLCLHQTVWKQGWWGNTAEGSAYCSRTACSSSNIQQNVSRLGLNSWLRIHRITNSNLAVETGLLVWIIALFLSPSSQASEETVPASGVSQSGSRSLWRDHEAIFGAHPKCAYNKDAMLILIVKCQIKLQTYSSQRKVRWIRCSHSGDYEVIVLWDATPCSPI
jgi:hypothetical protein